MRIRRMWRPAASLVVVAVVALGCASNGDEDTTGSAGGDTGAEATTTAAAPTVETEGGTDGDEAIVFPPADGPTTSVVVSALGGIRFEYPADLAYVSFDDAVLIHPEGTSPNDRSAALVLVTQLASGAPVADLDTYFEAIEKSHDVTPTGTSISFHGFELDGYDLSGVEDTQIFATSRYPAPVQAAGGPDAFSRFFVAETPSGVLQVGVGGSAIDDAEAMLPALGTMLEGFEFVGPGLDPGLPAGEAIEPEDAGPPPPAVDEGGDGAAPPLGAPFSPAEPGRHELLNFGLAVSVDFDDGWFVQPNFPGVVVLTHPDSAGPNDRDIVFINSIAELVPVAGGPVRAGDPVDVSDIEALIETPPEGIAISDVDRFDLTAPGGTSTPVVSFSVAVSPESTCSPTDPCEFAFVTTYGFVKPLRHTDVHRVWWFPEHPNGPAAAVTAAPKPSEWMADAELLMGTLELSR